MNRITGRRGTSGAAPKRNETAGVQRQPKAKTGQSPRSGQGIAARAGAREASRSTDSAAKKAYAEGCRHGKAVTGHPGAPASLKTFHPPFEYSAEYEKGWREAAYEKYAAWIRGMGKTYVPPFDEVFAKPKQEDNMWEPPASMVPTSGSYREGVPGSRNASIPFCYQRTSDGHYVIRSGNGVPNRFDPGTVVTEDEMYKILVGAGRIKP